MIKNSFFDKVDLNTLNEGNIEEILQQERNEKGLLIVENKKFSNLAFSKLPSNVAFCQCWFENVRFYYECNNFCFQDCYLEKCAFGGEMANTLFSRCFMNYCTFNGDDFGQGKLENNQVYNCDFNGVDFQSTKMYCNEFHLSSFVRGTRFREINLETNEFYECNFHSTIFYETNPFAATVNMTDAFLYPVCPQEGSFIAFKKVIYKKNDIKQAIAKLLIPEDAKRSSATTRKCRASKAKVLSITDIITGEQLTEAFSWYDYKFKYEVGKTIEVPDFNEDRWQECAAGIHFFMSKEEALIY